MNKLFICARNLAVEPNFKTGNICSMVFLYCPTFRNWKIDLQRELGETILYAFLIAIVQEDSSFFLLSFTNIAVALILLQEMRTSHKCFPTPFYCFFSSFFFNSFA